MLIRPSPKRVALIAATLAFLGLSWGCFGAQAAPTQPAASPSTGSRGMPVFYRGPEEPGGPQAQAQGAGPQLPLVGGGGPAAPVPLLPAIRMGPPSGPDAVSPLSGRHLPRGAPARVGPPASTSAASAQGPPPQGSDVPDAPCAAGVARVQCFAEPCSMARGACGPGERCQNDYCGGCGHRCVAVGGKQLQASGANVTAAPRPGAGAAAGPAHPPGRAPPLAAPRGPGRSDSDCLAASAGGRGPCAAVRCIGGTTCVMEGCRVACKPDPDQAATAGGGGGGGGSAAAPTAATASQGAAGGRGLRAALLHGR